MATKSKLRHTNCRPYQETRGATHYIYILKLETCCYSQNYLVVEGDPRFKMTFYRNHTLNSPSTEMSHLISLQWYVQYTLKILKKVQFGEFVVYKLGLFCPKATVF